MKTDKIAPDVAEAEFYRMCELLDLDVTTSNDEDKDQLETHKAKIVAAIVSGTMTIGDDGLPTVATKAGAELVFTMPTGATLLEADKAPEGQNNRRMFLLVGALTRGKFAPSKCTVKEAALLMSVTALFLAD